MSKHLQVNKLLNGFFLNWEIFKLNKNDTIKDCVLYVSADEYITKLIALVNANIEEFIKKKSFALNELIKTNKNI